LSLSPGERVDRYVIRRKLAEGGMAEVFLASHRGPEGFEKDVVLKCVRSALASDPSFVKMFVAEARIASKLNHANIVHIFDFDRYGTTYYLAMEYVPGGSLAELQSRARARQVAIPPLLAAQVALEVVRGLGYAHRLTDQGQPLHLVHRDVTPHNVLLSFDGAVKLGDFGIAKATSQATTAGMLKGKFAYMSPEQARGEPVDARTDLYALGITLWETLTLTRLFDGESDVAVLRAVQEQPIGSPVRLNPRVDPDLEGVVMRALERSPAARFQSAQELERALHGYVARRASSLEDTDVGALVRVLFADELRAALPAAERERAALSTLATPPPEGASEDSVLDRTRTSGKRTSTGLVVPDGAQTPTATTTWSPWQLVQIGSGGVVIVIGVVAIVAALYGAGYLFVTRMLPRRAHSSADAGADAGGSAAASSLPASPTASGDAPDARPGPRR
jgi:serine/threonine protein kinase